MSAKIQYEEIDGIAVLTLDDPPANTYKYGMMLELDKAILQARMEEDVHVIVLRGAGGTQRLARVEGKTSRAVGRIKRAVQSGAEMGFHEGLALERELPQQLFRGEDAREGLDAYLAKRKPEFKAR
jgi:enoyl-CoA hydratase/carnithine racemase